MMQPAGGVTLLPPPAPPSTVLPPPVRSKPFPSDHKKHPSTHPTLLTAHPQASSEGTFLGGGTSEVGGPAQNAQKSKKGPGGGLQAKACGVALRGGPPSCGGVPRGVDDAGVRRNDKSDVDAGVRTFSKQNWDAW